MANPSKVHKDFVGEPMDDKPVEALPGIGKALGAKLREKGFTKASRVFGKFLQLDKNEKRFKEWLAETCGADKGDQDACYKGLKEWGERYFQ